jgi:hypothetical protein
MTLFSMVMSSQSLSWSKMESYPFPWTSTKGGIPLSELMVIEKNHPNLSSSCSQLTRFSEITRSFTTSNRNWFSRLVRANSSLPCAWKNRSFWKWWTIIQRRDPFTWNVPGQEDLSSEGGRKSLLQSWWRHMYYLMQTTLSKWHSIWRAKRPSKRLRQENTGSKTLGPMNLTTFHL